MNVMVLGRLWETTYTEDGVADYRIAFVCLVTPSSGSVHIDI